MVRGEVEVLRRVLGEKRTTGDAQDFAEERDAKNIGKLSNCLG